MHTHSKASQTEISPTKNTFISCNNNQKEKEKKAATSLCFHSYWALHILLTLTVDNVPLLQWSEVRNTMTDHLIDGPAGSETRTAKAEVRDTVTDHLIDGPAGLHRDKNRKS